MRKVIIRFFLSVLILLVVAYLGIAWMFSGMVLIPRRQVPNPQHVMIAPDILPQPTEFSLKGTDEIELKGWYFKQPDSTACAVVLIHGWGNTRSGMLKYGDIFWDCDCDLIAYDHRAHSESEGEYATGGVKEKNDLLIVTDWVREQSGLEENQIGWVGASWGASTALQAGATEKDIAFILADSPFQDWETAVTERALRWYGSWVNAISPTVLWLVDQRAGVDHEAASVLIAAPQVEAPVFLIHSQTDEATASFQSVNIAKQLNPDRHVFYHTDWGAGHTKDVDERPEEFRQLVYDFVAKFSPEFGTCGMPAALSAPIDSH